MLILDPKSGQSIAVNLSFERRPFSVAAGSNDARKVPTENRDFLAETVRFDLPLKHKTTRHSWVRSNDEHNKNHFAFRIHGDCLHFPRARPRHYPTQEP